YPRRRYAHHRARRLDAQTPRRCAQFTLRRRAHHPVVATATALSSRLPTLLLRRPLHHPRDARIRQIGPTPLAIRALPARRIPPALSGFSAKTESLHLRSHLFLAWRLARLASACRVLSSPA